MSKKSPPPGAPSWVKVGRLAGARWAPSWVKVPAREAQGVPRAHQVPDERPLPRPRRAQDPKGGVAERLGVIVEILGGIVEILGGIVEILVDIVEIDQKLSKSTRKLSKPTRKLSKPTRIVESRPGRGDRPTRGDFGMPTGFWNRRPPEKLNPWGCVGSQRCAQGAHMGVLLGSKGGTWAV